ncbi:MAG: hypothetical protein M3020_17240 [Myxococcota bacterium]|nr:hypothetical protein [Myxococcota bacterium]
MTSGRAQSGVGRRLVALTALLLGCSTQTLDAGSDVPRGLLPVDERNPVILSNDGTGDWFGLYAILFANTGGPRLAAITVNSSSYAEDLDENLAAWRELVDAARASGLQNIPDPTASIGPPLVRPSSGEIAATVPNASQGARSIVEVSAQLGSAARPVVIAVGGRLTDVADAYLLDPTVAERVVVVAALGSVVANGDALMGAPNGELDPWADAIVARRFRYVQVSSFYDATADLPAAELADLPVTPLRELVAELQPNITDTYTRADQVAVLAAALPGFVVDVERAVPETTTAPDPLSGPRLLSSEDEGIWLVTGIAPATAGAALRSMLRDPATYGD